MEDLRILVVIDQQTCIDRLRDAFASSGFGNVESTTDADAIDGMTDPPDLIVLKMALPGTGGLAVLERLQPQIQAEVSLPVVALTEGAGERDEALGAGAQDFVPAPVDTAELVRRVRQQLELRALRLVRSASERDRRDRERSGIAELEAARLEVVERLARAGEFRDDETGEHTRRVGATAARLALAAGVDRPTARAIGLAAPLHDIGKIAIPDAILLRRGRLSPEEIEVMQRHTTIGAQILDGSSSRLLNLARDIALTHHERWDGDGYPSGTSGRDIPLAGRIVALADVFDALTHERPYKQAWEIGRAVDEVAAQAGRQFEPALVTAFLSIDHAALV
ncbi:MAG TPA: HD domain-containing phosphohydrolase [Solirubrobacteraceae bacterium]|nr:HD domain-containing phosphohydrolase [Solirubrobacteraceae bacterium]